MTKIIKDARVHYAVLKIRAVPLLVRRLPVIDGWFSVRVARPGHSTRPEKASPLLQDSCIIDRVPRRQADSTNGRWSSIAPHVNVPPLSKPLRNRRPKRALASQRDADAP
jgi:hypothetical protein